jgi:hypothetical protein
VYYRQLRTPNAIFDLKTGRRVGEFKTNAYEFYDIAFDKRGYMHGHTIGTVWRVDPDQAELVNVGHGKRKALFYPEVPYDYGVIRKESFSSGWQGALHCKDQGGAKTFQDGLGVNMRGDVAVQSNIYYVPRMEEAGYQTAAAGQLALLAEGGYVDGLTYPRYMKKIKDRQKRGENIYFIRRQPGIPLAGGTIWTFDRSGELRHECAAIMRWIINGVQIDEDGFLYFANASPRILDPKDGFFLAGKAGTYGADPGEPKKSPFTGTLVKTRGGNVRMRMATAPVPMDPVPARKPDVMAIHYTHTYSEKNWAWIEGAEWLYAGASLIKPRGCSCPVQRFHLDWYKRSYVPEAYRHSFGILDTNGNLIMHLGKYGNLDSGNGPKSKIPVGGDHIAVFQPRFISGTDNYLAFEDWGERLVVLRLEYHSEETVPIRVE